MTHSDEETSTTSSSMTTLFLPGTTAVTAAQIKATTTSPMSSLATLDGAPLSPSEEASSDANHNVNLKPSGTMSSSSSSSTSSRQSSSPPSSASTSAAAAAVKALEVERVRQAEALDHHRHRDIEGEAAITEAEDTDGSDDINSNSHETGLISVVK